MTTIAAPSWQPPAPARSSETAVEIQGLGKRFSVRRSLVETLRRPFDWQYANALLDVNLEVRNGEFFGLLGPNGAGKTTLFKILATLITPDHGTATILGLDIVGQADAVRRVLVPVVADERSLRWRLSARENLQLYAALYRIPKETLADRVEEMLTIVGLADTGNKMAGQFSSGMKQRLLIARALLANPRILLLDEPTRGLDPLSARKLRAFLREEICHRHGCTVLLATHNTEEAFELCDRVGILDRGRLLVAGAAASLAAQYGEQRYRLWTTDPQHPALTTLMRRDLVEECADGGPGPDGWSIVDMKIRGGPSQASLVLQFLVGHEVSVARFEPVGLSLADLIERVQQQLGENRNA